MNFRTTGFALALCLSAAPAFAQDTIKIGYIDPLSGGGASVGEGGLKTFQYLADQINAAGGLNGKKVEIVGLDNKTNPQESLIQAQKAADQGIRIITQGNGSSVGVALSDWVTKFNDRNPGKEMIYLNYAAVDPILTNDKCSYWHFRWDANSDIKMAALTNMMKVQPCNRRRHSAICYVRFYVHPWRSIAGDKRLLRVEFTRSPRRRGMSAVCSTADGRSDVRRSYWTAPVDGTVGGKRTLSA